MSQPDTSAATTPADDLAAARAEAAMWKRRHDEAHVTILRLSRMLAYLEIDDFEKAQGLPPLDQRLSLNSPDRLE